MEKILVVDDEELIRTVLFRALSREKDYEVILAATGNEAMEKIREHRPDLIVLDWELPGMSGMDVLREVRQDTRLKETPIIMLTARGGMEDRLKGLVVGANEYLSKPFDVRELMLHIGKLLSQVRKVQYLNPLIGVLGESFTEKGIEDLGHDLEMPVNPFLQELIIK